MPVQDDAREQQMVLLFNLSVPEDRQRADIDARLHLEELQEPLPFELKSTAGRSVSTVRDFGPEHIAKWRDLHWLFAFYGPGGSGTPLYCSYASPADMAPWIAEKERYVRPDLVLAQRAPQQVTPEDLVQVLGEDRDSYTRTDAKAIMKNQWTAMLAAAEIIPKMAELAIKGNVKLARMIAEILDLRTFIDQFPTDYQDRTAGNLEQLISASQRALDTLRPATQSPQLRDAVIIEMNGHPEAEHR